MTLDELLTAITESPDTVDFNDVIEVVQANYRYTATEFTNGLGDALLVNQAGTNEGSCKVFAFAKLNQLNEAQTLACFGGFYRDDVLQNLEGNDHQNIRNFIKYGWSGISFSGPALQ